MNLERRGFLGVLAAGVAGVALDPERLLWQPGKRTYVDLWTPPKPPLVTDGWSTGMDFQVGDVLTIGRSPLQYVVTAIDRSGMQADYYGYQRTDVLTLHRPIETQGVLDSLGVRRVGRRAEVVDLTPMRRTLEDLERLAPLTHGGQRRYLERRIRELRREVDGPSLYVYGPHGKKGASA